jgi:hypothetical protein
MLCASTGETAIAVQMIASEVVDTILRIMAKNTSNRMENQLKSY